LTERSARALTESAASSDGTREPQYNRCLEIRDAEGLTPLGLMTNQVWHDDPRRLAFLLSRYKFVSKMLSGKKLVGELGCGDAFGTRIVLQEVERVIAYDFDPVFVEDIKQRQSKRWPIEVNCHDIIEAPLPYQHDGIYSLDVIEHISIRDEDAYLANLSLSLASDGVLIIGTPTLESQTYASPPSKQGHINCKTGAQLRALLQRYFHNVFLFSMNDEVVHTGFAPMAHYLFAVCCQKKVELA
jgi:2-polyprenyl-3-methyl-5-hydroxy-6-metoxy-1,4-benzoquinol methylase